MSAIRPVLTVVPTAAHIEGRRHAYEPGWDSCDGMRSTYGWDDVTVDVGFTDPGPAAPIVAVIDQQLRHLGWTPSQPFGDGVWYWTKTVRGETANVQLLGGPDSRPSDWDLLATVAAATHPVKGC